MWRKILRGIGVLFIVTVVTVVVLVKFFGLRTEPYGAGYKPHFYFYKADEHFAALEKSRAAQKAAQPAPVVTPTALSENAPEAEKTIEPGAPAKPPAGGPLYWTNFRGPRRDGIYAQGPVRTSWPSEGLPRLWKQPIGGGYASFVVAHGRAYTIEQRRDKEVVSAYDVNTGLELWTNSWTATFQESMGGPGPRATPTWDDGRIYALGATGEFRCLDAGTGKTLWSHNILTENQATNIQWGMAASALVIDDKVIVLPGGAGGKSVVAYNKQTGKIVWSVFDDKQAYTAPVAATISGVRQIIVVSAQRVMGLKPEDGGLLWEYPWVTDYGVNSAEPVFIDDHRFFLSAGYDHGGVLLDVSRNGEAFTVKPVWETKRMKNRFNASVFYQGNLYGLDEGILACIDAATGALKWKGGRYGYGQVLLASGHLIVLTEDGDLVLVKATPEKLEEVSRFTAIEGKTWNYPAIDDGRLLVRNTTEMAAFKIR